MKRQCLSLRIPYSEPRTIVDEHQIAILWRRLEQTKAQYPLGHILKFDETSLKCSLNSRQCLSETDTGLGKLKKRGGEKECETGDGYFSTADDKLPFSVMAKGRTDRRFARWSHQMITSQTPAGWINEQVMIHYLEQLCDDDHGELLFPILDVHNPHRKERKAAEWLNWDAMSKKVAQRCETRGIASRESTLGSTGERVDSCRDPGK
jgi:hypothetical protein